MKIISRALLLSAVSLCVCGGRVTYASFEEASSRLKSGIPTLHTHHTHKRHTLQRLDLSSQLFDDVSVYGQKVASVCFITDTSDCGGNGFGNIDSPDGNDNGHGTPEELCKDAGYTNEPCPEGKYPSEVCPYDDSYHGKCSCPNEYDEVCDTALGEEGVGESCDGKYKECCNKCEGYDYTSIPEGYVSDGECDSCDGKKYKIKCDPYKYPSSNNECGTQGGGGNSCTDDEGTHYQECNCPLNYEWNEVQKKCVCSSSFRYSCQGTGYVGGSGTECDGSYSRCVCQNGYVWNEAQGACVCNGIDWCSLNQDCAALGYAKQSCNCNFVKCPFDTSYVFCLDCDGTTEPEDNNCTYGDIYYSDKTCSKEYISSKIPIGVVVYDENGEKWAMSLKIAGGGTWTFEMKDVDIPEIANYLTAEEAATDLKSCENTTALFNYVKGELEYEARYSLADIAKNYAPVGAESTKGQWCLPAAGIWNMVSKHRTEIDAAISRAKGEPFSSTYSSSSERDPKQVWKWSSHDNLLFLKLKMHETSNAARPVIRIQ